MIWNRSKAVVLIAFVAGLASEARGFADAAAFTDVGVRAAAPRDHCLSAVDQRLSEGDSTGRDVDAGLGERSDRLDSGLLPKEPLAVVPVHRGRLVAGRGGPLDAAARAVTPCGMRSALSEYRGRAGPWLRR